MRIIKAIYHLAYFVNDIDKSIEYYEKLGMETVFKLNHEDGRVWLAYVRVAPNQYLELFPAYEDAPFMAHSTIIQSMSDPLGHLALQVFNLKAAALEWAKKGIRLLYDPRSASSEIPLDDFKPSVGADGCLIGWLVDPDGNKIEVMEQPGETLQQQFEKKHPII